MAKSAKTALLLLFTLFLGVTMAADKKILVVY